MNNLDVPEGKFCYDIIQKAGKFDLKWYDWSESQVREYLDKNSGNNYVFIEYHHTDLGRDDKWLKEQVKALLGDMAKVKREILIEWTYASNMSIFTEEQLDKLSKYATSNNIHQFILLDGYQINILEECNNMMYKNWCLSIDIGGGLGRDYSAFSLIDPVTYKAVMNFKNNNIGVLEFADLVIKFVNTYVPNAVIIPERNFNSAFIEHIQKSNISKRLYYTSTDDKDYTVQKIKKTSIFKKNSVGSGMETRKYGFLTDTTKRKVMTEEILYMIVENKPELCNNELLFNEMRKLIREKSGKINHMNGEHDDLLMSYLIGLFVLLYSNNRNKFFKNVSNEPVLGYDKKEPNKMNINFKKVADFNNEEKLKNSINDKLDPELVEMQRMIDEKNKVIKPVREKTFKSIFNLNK